MVDRKIKVKKQRQLNKEKQRRDSRLRRDSFSMNITRGVKEEAASATVSLGNAGGGHFESMHLTLTGLAGLPPLLWRGGGAFQVVGPNGRALNSPSLDEILAQSYLQVRRWCTCIGRLVGRDRE